MYREPMSERISHYRSEGDFIHPVTISSPTPPFASSIIRGSFPTRTSSSSVCGAV